MQAECLGCEARHELADGPAPAVCPSCGRTYSLRLLGPVVVPAEPVIAVPPAPPRPRPSRPATMKHPPTTPFRPIIHILLGALVFVLTLGLLTSYESAPLALGVMMLFVLIWAMPANRAVRAGLIILMVVLLALMLWGRSPIHHVHGPGQGGGPHHVRSLD